jgi:hypothetical protein
LYDGAKVDGPVSLRNALVRHSDLFVRGFTVKLLTYALGRGVEYYDMPTVRAIERESARDNHTFSSLVLAIVRSAPFQMTKAPEAVPATSAANSAEFLPVKAKENH